MNLKIRLTLLYGFSVLTILVISAVSIFFLNENFRINEFYKRLVTEARNNTHLLYTLPKLSPETIQQLELNAALNLPHEEIAVYDPFFHLIYTTEDKLVKKLTLSEFLTAKKYGQYSFVDGQRESILWQKDYNGKDYYLLISAVDFFGHRKTDNLKIILFLSVMGGILLSGLASFLYVRQAMKPLEELKEKIENINVENLTERILVSPNSDEVRQISMKFNAMLDRLEQAFEQRKNFVHHASHELRTPLATMLAQTESALSVNLPIEGYQKVLQSLKEDQQDIIELTNSLLTLSRYEKITVKNDWIPVRIDEILYEIAEAIGELLPSASITIDFKSIPEDDNLLVFTSNEALIKSALQNLVKNALQYSEDLRAGIIISATEAGIILHFDNVGKQLTAEEQKRLFIPFFRGANSTNKKGYGLGLSIVERIIRLHQAWISYQPIGGNINRFTVFLPHL
ncbi:MAG TPA: ATP-binding protein [Segetibacter sp.]|jgi:signal transduction histidine kinase